MLWHWTVLWLLCPYQDLSQHTALQHVSTEQSVLVCRCFKVILRLLECIGWQPHKNNLDIKFLPVNQTSKLSFLPDQGTQLHLAFTKTLLSKKLNFYQILVESVSTVTVWGLKWKFYEVSTAPDIVANLWILEAIYHLIYFFFGSWTTEFDEEEYFSFTLLKSAL